MKKYILDFARRGAIGCGVGPLVLAALYLIVYGPGSEAMLSVNQVCTGIFSIALLAFLAGGINVLYQIERLPLTVAILIHGLVLYVAYLCTYLVNGWLDGQLISFLVFTGIFVVGYLVIWAIIYSIIKRSTDKINASLRKKQTTQNQNPMQ